MAFKLYTDKSSLKKKTSRYVRGGVSSAGVKFIRWWERFVISKNSLTDMTYVIPKVYEFSPDLIAYDYYGKNNMGWVILQYNNIIDINEELSVGKTILLPEKNRVFYELLSQ